MTQIPRIPQVGVEEASERTLADWIRERGLSREWSPEEREQVREAHDGLLEEWKRKHKNGSRRIDEIPGLLPSVQRLLDQGYCISDIGDMLGITRERVRQWCDEYDLDRSNAPNGSAFRVWDPDLGHFRAASVEEMGRVVGRARKRRIERQRAEIIHERLREDIEHLRAVAQEHELATLARLEERVGVAFQSLLHRWADVAGGETYATATERLYETAGVEKPKQGSWERGPQTVARREDPFGRMITEGRLAKGWTHRDLAKRVGVSAGAISHWENGTTMPSDEHAMRLGEALGWGEAE